MAHRNSPGFIATNSIATGWRWKTQYLPEGALMRSRIIVITAHNKTADFWRGSNNSFGIIAIVPDTMQH